MLNGETLLSFWKARGLASKAVSGMALMLCGFAGTFGFSARLIGGGRGDFGRRIAVAGPALTVDVSGFLGAIFARSRPGVADLVGEVLLCCETNPCTFPTAEVSILSGE